MEHVHAEKQLKTELFHIIVNARQHTVPGPKVSYREIVNLAFPGDTGEIIYLVQYTAPHRPDGALHDGDSIEAENGMKCDVTPTNRA